MEWIRGPVIGRGATATVSLATAISSGEIFAVKSTELCHSMLLERENYILSKLSCPRIVKYIGHDFTYEANNNQPTYNLCMEYVPGGTLFEEIRRVGGKLEEEKIRLYGQQILQGLEYLHVNGVVHCDIKSQNILLGEEGAKIADLGCAKLIGKAGDNEGFATSAFSGTPAFMAPEVARGEDQGFEADIWAFGCTIIEMVTGKPPWPELNDHPVSALYKIGFSGDVPEIPKWLSEKGKDFLGKCLSWDAKQRCSAKELLQHPYLEDLSTLWKEVKESAMDSPSSVLDHGFWDSLDVVETPKNLLSQGIPLKSPADRIKELVEITLSPAASNWTWSDEDWITVRSNAIEEEDFSLANLSFEEELEIESSILDEDFLIENSIENVFGFNTAFDSVSDDISVVKNLKFETVINENSCSIPNSFFTFNHIPNFTCKFLQIFLGFSLGVRQR
ncbi:hypothetical protein PTKIN_Ptkin11bG0184900 [Pterospermum kingtungense]